MIPTSPILLKSEIYPTVDSQTFFDAIESAKTHGRQQDFEAETLGTINSRWYGAFVNTYSVNEYSKMSCYLFAENRAGFALNAGDIVSVFKHPDYPKGSSALKVTITAAIALGGNRLDCFNGRLPILYGEYGFIPVAKIKFNKLFAPVDWNYERDKEPDIIYMIYKDNFNVNELDSDKQIDDLISREIEVLSYSTYEEAQATQLSLVE